MSLAELVQLIEHCDLHQLMKIEPTVSNASSQKQIELKCSVSEQTDQSNYILHLTYKVIKKHILKYQFPYNSQLNHKHKRDTKYVPGHEINIESLPYFISFVINLFKTKEKIYIYITANPSLRDRNKGRRSRKTYRKE